MSTEYNAIDSHIERLKNTIYTSVPAKVTKVNTEGDSIYSVSAKPINDKLWRDGLLLTRKPIPNIPLVFPSGGGGLLSFPVKEGDYVLLLFSQEDIDNFLSKGEDSGKPNTLRKFSLTDAIAIPCVYPLGDDLKPSQDDVEIKFKDSVIRVDSEGNVEIESSKDITASSEGKINITTGSTFSVQNETVELISLLSDFLEDCSQITTPTIFGGTTPINNLASFTSLKAKIDTMKEG